MAQFGNTGERISEADRFFKLEMWADMNGQAAVCSRSYRTATPVGAGITFGQILAHFAGIVPALFKPLMTVTAEYRGMGVRGYRGTNLGLAAAAYDNAGFGVGTAGTDGLPTQSCGLIKFTSNESGPRGRGRIYLPFPDEANNTVAAIPDIAYVAAASALATALVTTQVVLNGADGMTLVPIILNKTLFTWRAITGFAVRVRWATQKRRGAFGRTNAPPV